MFKKQITYFEGERMQIFSITMLYTDLLSKCVVTVGLGHICGMY